MSRLHPGHKSVFRTPSYTMVISHQRSLFEDLCLRKTDKKEESCTNDVIITPFHFLKIVMWLFFFQQKNISWLMSEFFGAHQGFCSACWCRQGVGLSPCSAALCSIQGLATWLIPAASKATRSMNPAGLIGILIMVYYDPHITGWDFIPYTPETTKVVFIAQFNLYTEYTYADAYIIPCLKLTVRPSKWMIGRRSFPFGIPYFQGLC